MATENAVIIRGERGIQGLSANSLKIIAIIAMLIDHIAWAFVPTNTILGQAMHLIGRLTAPIMCFLLAEGYHHTRNIKKYALRLGIFALISHFPFVYFQTGWLPFLPSPGGRVPFATSVIYTLFLGLLALAVYKNRDLRSYVKWLLISLICIAEIPGDWAFFAVLWILSFGANYGNLKEQLVGFVVVSALVAIFTIGVSPGDCWWGQLFQLGVFLAMPFFMAYNGERGYSEKNGWVKWIFYIFYPLHLLVLGLLKFVFLL